MEEMFLFVDMDGNGYGSQFIGRVNGQKEEKNNDEINRNDNDDNEEIDSGSPKCNCRCKHCLTQDENELIYRKMAYLSPRIMSDVDAIIF